MVLDWILTLAGLAAGIGLFFYARAVAQREPDPLKPRFFNYNLVALAALIFIIVLCVHLIALLMGGSPMRTR